MHIVSLTAARNDFAATSVSVDRALASSISAPVRIMAANTLFSVAMENSGLNPAEAEWNRCFEVAVRVLHEVPPLTAPEGAQIKPFMGQVLTLRQIVATGRFADAEGRMERFAALIDEINALLAVTVSETERQSILSSRCAVLREWARRALLAGGAEEVLRVIERPEIQGGCSPSSIATELAEKSTTTQADRDRLYTWARANARTLPAHAKALYPRINDLMARSCVGQEQCRAFGLETIAEIERLTAMLDQIDQMAPAAVADENFPLETRALYRRNILFYKYFVYKRVDRDEARRIGTLAVGLYPDDQQSDALRTELGLRR